MKEPSICVKNLTKSFGDRKAVDALSFAVKKGEVFALLGHNGAGKSTTIDLILGLKTPDRATAKILGMDAAKTENRCLSGLACSCRILSISRALPWKKCVQAYDLSSYKLSKGIAVGSRTLVNLRSPAAPSACAWILFRQ